MEVYRLRVYDQLNNTTVIDNLQPAELVKAINAEDDNGGFDFISSTITENIPQFTLAKLEYLRPAGGTVSFQFFWISSQCVQINETEYKHTVKIIELTKLLEKVYFGNATVTNPIDNATGLPITNKTIADVVDRLCRIVDLKFSADTSDLRFMLNPSKRERLAAIPSREFTFNPTQTFYETLKQVGEFIQAELRLEITFDEFGERQYLISFDFWNDKAINANGGDYVRHIKDLIGEQYHTEIVSDVQNAYPEGGEEASAITTPNITLRARNGTYYDSTSDLVFNLPQKIDKLKSFGVGRYEATVLVAGLPGSQITFTVPGASITKYVYEKAIYETLDQGDSFGEKGMSLFYEQYGNLIDGFMYRSPAIFGFFEEYAIKLILEKVAVDYANAQSFPNSPNYTSGTLNTAIAELEFISIFEPLQNIFTKHTKVVENKTEKAELVFNQTENIVDTKSLGTAIKQNSDKMGNSIFEKDYILDSFEDIIELGTFNDDNYFVTKTKIQIFNNYIKQTVSWSKDYVALSEYIGIDSLNRQYQVPATGDIIDRKLYFKEYLDLSFTDKIDTAQALSKFQIMYMFNKSDDATRLLNEIKPVEFVVVYGIDKNAVDLNNVILTATSIGLGEKLNFNFKMQGNYSAGKTSYAISGKTQRQQKDYPYADEYGEIEKLAVAFVSYSEFDGWTATEIKEQALAYPRFTKGSVALGNILLAFLPSLTDTLYIEKDARETINLNYEIQFVTSEPEIIIGSYLAEENALIQDFSGRQLYVWLSNTEVNKNTRYVPSDAVQISDLENVMPNSNYANNIFLQTGVNYTGSFATHKSWFIADADGKVFVGANQNLNNFTPSSNIFEETRIYFNDLKEI